MHRSINTPLSHHLAFPKCRSTDVESKEKAHHRLPLSMPKAKDGALDNVEDNDEENAVENSNEDSKDGDSETDLPDALRSAFSRLSARQDERAHRQQLQVGHLEQNIAYMVSMMQFYHGVALSSVVPQQPPPTFQLPTWPPTTPTSHTTPMESYSSNDDHTAS